MRSSRARQRNKMHIVQLTVMIVALVANGGFHCRTLGIVDLTTEGLERTISDQRPESVIGYVDQTVADLFLKLPSGRGQR